jgi:hypothetical protein
MSDEKIVEILGLATALREGGGDRANHNRRYYCDGGVVCTEQRDWAINSR